MVRREGTRFGIATSHNVRRLPFPYKQAYAEQSIFIETKIDAQDHRLKKRAKAAMKKQMQRGAFNVNDNTAYLSPKFSLNKAKRWEVIEDIKEDADCHGNRNIITEHHMLYLPRSPNSAAGTCTGVYDSTADTVRRSPKKGYAKASDLMSKQGEAVMEEDEDFGKKNRRRSRKRRANQEENVHLSTVQYEVYVAAPRQTYQTYCNPAGHLDFGKRNKNSRNRTKKLHQCNMRDVYSDGLREFEEEYDHESYDWEGEEMLYWQDETKDADPYQRCTDSLEALINKAVRPESGYNQDDNAAATSQRSTALGTKDRVFMIDEADAIAAIHPDYIIPIRDQRQARKGAEEKKEAMKVKELPAPSITPEKPFVAVSLSADDITSDELRGKFGDCYVEGLSMPRRFAINITDKVIDQLQSRADGTDLANILIQTGHNIMMIIDCLLDPWLTLREDHCLVEDIRVKVSGVREDRYMLTNALTRLDLCDICTVVSVISESLATLSVESYLIDKTVPSLPAKPALDIGTIQSTLGWQYDVTNPNKATQQALDRKDAQSSETGAMVPSSASNACDSCNICYEELSERCPGTALTACSHWFCDECWMSHLIARVEQGDINITCPGFKCTSTVDKVTMMSLLPSNYYARHHGHKTNTALMLQPELHWCPSPSCGRLLKLTNQRTDIVREGGVVPVNCECGTFWCSECKDEAHWPATCQQAKTYRQGATESMYKMKAEPRDVRVSTKRCPRCGYPIEKCYGCNHMQCKCGHDFCWNCGVTWRLHGVVCDTTRTIKSQVFTIRPEDIVEWTAVELAVIHHRRRSQFACHRRNQQARKLASKLDFQSKIDDKDSDDTASLLTSTSSVSMVTTDRGPSPHLREMRRILGNAAHFLSEAEFVLEHLEILLSSAPGNQKRVLSQHKTRLLFITDNLHKIFNEEVKLDIDKVQFQVHCGKSCLRWIATAATHLTHIMTAERN